MTIVAATTVEVAAIEVATVAMALIAAVVGDGGGNDCGSNHSVEVTAIAMVGDVVEGGI